MKGMLFGVGLGPGDPELMTRKAVRLIREAKIIAYPEPSNGSSFARSIAEEFLPEEVLEIPISIPMLEDTYPAKQIYEEAARTISKHLQTGTDVIVLCQGDPFFYGSFMYLFTHFVDSKFSVEIVPGVSSLNSCASVAQNPLCARMEPLRILPAPMPEDQLVQELERIGGAVIVKVGRHMSKIRRVLKNIGIESEAVYISHATLPQQTVLKLEDAPEQAPYFSVILVPGQYLYGK